MAVLLFEITHKSNKIYIMMKSISKLLMMVPVLMAAMLCSCNDDNDTPIPSGAFTVFATLERLDNTGATFTTQELDDSELVTYVTTQELDSKIYTVGKRYVIVFSNQSGKRFQSVKSLCTWLTACSTARPKATPPPTAKPRSKIP